MLMKTNPELWTDAEDRLMRKAIIKAYLAEPLASDDLLADRAQLVALPASRHAQPELVVAKFTELFESFEKHLIKNGPPPKPAPIPPGLVETLKPILKDLVASIGGIGAAIQELSKRVQGLQFKVVLPPPPPPPPVQAPAPPPAKPLHKTPRRKLDK